MAHRATVWPTLAMPRRSCALRLPSRGSHPPVSSCDIIRLGRTSPSLQRHEAQPRTINSGSARWPRRAGDLPQRRERLLRPQGEGARTPRSCDRGRPRRHHLGRRVDHRVRRMDQRSRPRSAVQGALSQDLGAKFDRWDREIPGLRDDPRHRAGLCQEDGQGLR